jgi:N-methylhydantoinase B
MYASDGTVYPAAGARGGLSGARAAQYKRSKSGEAFPLDPMGPVELNDGEIIMSVGAAGGGYGNPYEREIWRVEKDYREGWITRQRAEKVYGVVFTEDGLVDELATQAHRQSMRASGPAPDEYGDHTGRVTTKVERPNS